MPVVHELESSVKVNDPMNFVLIENGAISSIKYKRKYYGYKPIANGRKQGRRRVRFLGHDTPKLVSDKFSVPTETNM